MTEHRDAATRLEARIAARRRRLRRVLRRLPRRANVGRYPMLRHFAQAARRRPYLWSYRPRAITAALYAGCLISFLPLVGITLLLALAAAILVRGNLTLTVALQFLSNPLTSGPIFVATYLLGDGLLAAAQLRPAEPAAAITLALVLGGLVLGVLVAGALHVFVRHLHRRDQAERAQLAALRAVPATHPDPSFRFPA